MWQPALLEIMMLARHWWHTPLIPALVRQRQADLSEFETSLVFKSSFQNSLQRHWVTLSLKTKKKKKINYDAGIDYFSAALSRHLAVNNYKWATPDLYPTMRPMFISKKRTVISCSRSHYRVTGKLKAGCSVMFQFSSREWQNSTTWGIGHQVTINWNVKLCCYKDLSNPARL